MRTGPTARRPAPVRRAGWPASSKRTCGRRRLPWSGRHDGFSLETISAWAGARGTARSDFVPYFHRDSQRLSDAGAFAPVTWLAQDGPADGPLVPFKRRPGRVPRTQPSAAHDQLSARGLLERHRMRQAHERALVADEPDAGDPQPFPPLLRGRAGRLRPDSRYLERVTVVQLKRPAEEARWLS